MRDEYRTSYVNTHIFHGSITCREGGDALTRGASRPGRRSLREQWMQGGDAARCVSCGIARRFGKFQPVTPGIGSIKATDAVVGVVPHATDSGCGQGSKCLFDVIHRKRRMRFCGGLKILFHTDMKLARAYPKPAATP